MKKLGKRLTLVMGTTVIAVGIMALPALASNATNEGQGVWGKMQSFMSQTFTPGQHQQLMNSSAAQNLHNSAAMQGAMQKGDVTQMQSLMNSNPALKAELGQETLNKMNDFMNQNRGAIGQMMKGQTNSGSGMMR